MSGYGRAAIQNSRGDFPCCRIYFQMIKKKGDYEGYLMTFIFIYACHLHGHRFRMQLIADIQDLIKNDHL